MVNEPMFRSVAALFLIVLSPSLLGGQRLGASPVAFPTNAPLALGSDFVENRGQWARPSLFVAQLGGGMAASLESGGITLRVAGERPTDMALVFEGASTEEVTGEERRRAVYSFFLGNDRHRWRSNVPAFGAVRYRGLYDGVDLRVLRRDGQLQYDVLLRPGAEVDQVFIRAVGTTGMEIDADGGLILHTPVGLLRQTPPVTWEELPDGTTRRLDSRFRKIDAERYGFDVPGRTRDLPLVIDPGLEWSTFSWRLEPRGDSWPRADLRWIW